MELKVKTKDFNIHETKCLGIPNQTAGYSCNVKENMGYTTCHAGIRHETPENIKDFSGVYKFDVPGAMEMFKYLISENGPFRDLKLWEDIYLFGKTEDNPVGFTLPDRVFQFKPYPLLYAFLICSRIPHEHDYHAQSFGYLVSGGHDPNLMFIMSKHLAIKNNVLTSSGAYWASGHNAMVESDPYGMSYSTLIDVRKFCRGEYEKALHNNVATSNLWMMKKFAPKAKPLRTFMWGAYSEKIQTRFTTIDRIPSEQEAKMIEDFKKFVDLRYTS